MTKRDSEPNTEFVEIDEALEKTEFGRFNYLLIVFSGLVLVYVILESVGISFLLPVLDCDFRLSHRQQGVLGAVCFVGIIVSSHLWGFLADTIGRRRIMRPALLIGFLLTIASSFSPNFESLVVLRFLTGFSISGCSATVFAYLGEFHCQKHRSRAILAAACISAFSAIFFPVVAWLFINQSWQLYIPIVDIVFRPWRTYMLACGVPGFVCSLIMHFLLPESPKFLLAAGRNSECLAVLQDIHRRNARSSDNEYSVKSILPDMESNYTKHSTTNDCNSKNVFRNLVRSMWAQTAPLFMREHLRKTCLASLIQFVIFFTAHGVYMWFPYILNSTMQYTQTDSAPAKCLCDIIYYIQANTSNATPTTATATTTHGVAEPPPENCTSQLEISTYQHTIILELIYVGLLLCVSYVIGKLGRKPILFIILLVCGACGILSLVISVPLIAIYLHVLLLCCGLGTTVVNAIVVDIYPTNLRAMAVCISLMLGRVGSVAGSSVLGVLIGSHCNWAIHTASGLLILAAGLGCLLPKQSIPSHLAEKKPSRSTNNNNNSEI